MSAEWIKRSEREPTSKDYPVWCYYNGKYQSSICLAWIAAGWTAEKTHWMPANMPAPPPPERKSFKELDKEASIPLNPFMESVGSFHAGANHVRAQVRAVVCIHDGQLNYTAEAAIEQIRALVDEESPSP